MLTVKVGKLRKFTVSGTNLTAVVISSLTFLIDIIMTETSQRFSDMKYALELWGHETIKSVR